MTISDTARFLASRSDFIITSHESPDADGLGAEYSLGIALKSMGKNVRIVNAEHYSEAYGFIDTMGIIEHLASANLDKAAIQKSTAILVDTNDFMFTGEIADKIIAIAAETLVIDHHEVKGETIELSCLMPKLSSTCEMVYHIISELGYEINTDVASALFAGIVFDTGSFAYSKTGAGTFETALDLVRRGANPSDIHSALYESSDISVLLLRKAVFSTLELHADNRIAIQTMSRSMLAETGSLSQDSEGLINIPLQGATIQVSVFLKENEEGTLRCSLRSKGKINVAQIAQSFGGGGHKSAAGFKSPFPIPAIKERVLELLEAALLDC